MEKLVYLISRRDDVTREQFHRHYFDHHSVLALRTAAFLDGYTLNFTDLADPGPGGPDSITEIWTRDAAAFLDSARNFPNPGDLEEVAADDASFIGRNLRYRVDERLVLGDHPSGALRTRTPGVKRISLHSGDSRAPLAAGVTRVVELAVREVLSPAAPAVDVFVMEWAASASDFAPVPVPAYLTSEYRQRDIGPGPGPGTALARDGIMDG